MTAEMNAPIHYKSIQDPHDEDERTHMDPETWDWESSEVGVTVGEPGTAFTMEFSRDEHRLLAHAARAEGLTTLAFIKRSALAAAHVGAPRARQPVATKHAATG